MTDQRILVIGDRYMSAEQLVAPLTERGEQAATCHVTPIATPRWDAASLSEFDGDPAEVATLASGYDIVVVHAAPFTEQVFAALPDLKLLCCARGGPVNIDLDAARRHGVTVVTTPGKNAVAVAELTIGFLISLLRNTAPSVRQIDERIARGLPMVESLFDGAQWIGQELAATRVGLVGYGHVARLVADRVRALGAHVIAFDPFISATDNPGVELVPRLGALLETADVVSLHARASDANRHLMSDDEFASMRSGSYFINTARESLVDESALLRALRRGHVAGAALDVNEHDGLWPELIALPNVIVTPHLGGATRQTFQRGAEMLADDIAAYREGRDLRWSI